MGGTSVQDRQEGVGVLCDSVPRIHKWGTSHTGTRFSHGFEARSPKSECRQATFPEGQRGRAVPGHFSGHLMTVVL